MTREALAAMTDDEILVHYRHKHGDPYMPLSMAKKMQREERKWAHMTALHKKREAEGTLPAPQPCHYGEGTCLTHRRETP